LFLLTLAIIGLSTAVARLFDSTSLGQWIELRAYDIRFAHRGPLLSSDSPPIIILGLDEESLGQVTEPLVFWNRHFARVIDFLARGDAACIGVDFIFPDAGRYDPAGEQELSGALLRAGSGGVPVVLGYRERREGPEEPPASVFMAATAASHPLAFVNLTTDPDDFVRRQRIEARAEGAEQPGFALALARAYARRRDRPLRPLPDATDTIWINFREPGHFQTVPFVSALRAAEKSDEAFFRELFYGRVVLIGRTGLQGDEDLHPTPHYYWKNAAEGSRARRTPGVEIHANVIATLLDGNPIRHLALRDGFLTALGVIAAVTLLCLNLGPWVALVSSAAVFLAYLYVALDLAFARGWALPAVWPLGGCLVAVGASQVARYALEGREKRRLRRLFSRYVDDRVIAQILEQREHLFLRGERRKVTVLFADIRNFTSRSERADAAEIVAQLNRYFAAMVDVIQAHGGMVDKFIGDGIMAVFGSPLEDPESEFHAVKAAEGMLEALGSINSDLAREGAEPIEIGVGIHTGEGVVGNIGSPRRLEYTTIGDVVNVASRIEGLTRNLGARILVSGDTFEAVKGRVEAERVGEEKLKGRDRPVTVYRVAAEAPPAAAQG
jgi:adenylate cyclase